MATKGDLIEAQNFSRRRLLTAFVSGAPGGKELQPTAPLRAVIAAALLAFFVVMCWQGVVYMQAMSFQTTPATGIPFMYVYLGMPVGFVLLIVHLLLIVRDYVLHMRFKQSDEVSAEAAG